LPKVKSRKAVRIGTDCSGIEAPIQALEALKLKYKHLFSSEIDKKTQKLLFANYGKPKNFSDDITKRDHTKLPKIDLYVAGFPCQAFSHLGKRGGFDDYKGRGTIFFECYKTIIATTPSMFILENVKGLVTHDNGDTFKTILRYLNQLDYDIYHQILNTKDYGLPQNRERIFIIGLKKSKHNKFEFPKPIPLKITVSDILDKRVKKTELTEHKKNILKNLQKNGYKLSKPWVVNLNCSGYERSSPMLNISPCLMHSGAIYYITSKKRNLTPSEFLKLQGFHRFNFDGEYAKIYQAAGNSMSVSVIAFLIANMIKSQK